MPYCKICGEPHCKRHALQIGKKISIEQFTGSSPPEIFIGRWNYPNVYTGILAPQALGNTEHLSSAEHWHKTNSQIPDILDARNELIYARTQRNIKTGRPLEKQHNPLLKKFLSTMQEIAMTHKSIATNIALKKPVTKNLEKESRVPLISNAAPAKSVTLQENAKIKPKIDYLVNDTDVKSTTSLKELYHSGITNESLIKLLSAGLLGLKKNRRLVPTRWSITAVDDTLSKQHLSRIKTFPILQHYAVFSAEYLGNHYEFLLLPDVWSFEVIEIALKSQGTWHDHETHYARKTYADSVTGAYYANRLALTEYLLRKQKQAACLVFREIRPEYYAPLGVGILRQTSRQAFKNKPKIFHILQEVLNDIQSRLRLPVERFTSQSVLLKQKNTQTKLWQFVQHNNSYKENKNKN